MQSTEMKALIVLLAVIVGLFIVAMSITDADNPEGGSNESGGYITYHPYIESEETIKIASGSQYVLPQNWFAVPDGKIFVGWSVKIGNSPAIAKNPGDSITVTGEVFISPVWSDTIRVNFKAGEGTGTMSAIDVKDGVDTFPNCGFGSPVETTKHFYGWEVDGSVYMPGQVISVGHDFTAVALWGDVATVYLSINPNITGSEVEKKIYSFNRTMSYVLPSLEDTKAGYSFNGWSVKIGTSVAVQKNVGDVIQLTDNAEITAVWSTDGVPVEFSNSSDTSGSMASFTVPANSTFILPNFEFQIDESGKRFKCWDVQLYDSNGVKRQTLEDWHPGTPVNLANYLSEDVKKVVLSNRLETDKGNTIQYYLDSSDTDPENTVLKWTWRHVLPNNWMQKTGMKFIGWHVQQVQNGVVTTEFDTYPGYVMEQTDSSGKISFKVIAMWVAQDTEGRKIIFDADGGSGSMDPVSTHQGMTYVLPNSKFTAPTGKVFAGWEVAGVKRSPGYVISIEGADISVKARWEESSGVTVSFDAGVGGTGSMSSYSVSSGLNFVIPDSTFSPPSEGGKYFSEWFVKIGDSEAVYKYPGQEIKVSSNTVLTAQWAAPVNDYATVKFVSGDESATGSMDDVVLIKRQTFMVPDSGFTAPTGKVFLGWILKDTFPEVYYNPLTIVSVESDITLVAQWGDNGIVYHGNGGTGAMKNATWVSSYTLPDNGFGPVSKNDFSRWSVKIGSADPVEKMPGDVITPSDNLVIIEPIWAPTITIYFDAGAGTESTEHPFDPMRVVSGSDARMPDSEYVDLNRATHAFEAPKGQYFEGWRVGDQIYQPGQIINFDRDVTATAVWGFGPTGSIYRISFSGDSGIEGPIAISKDSKRYILPIGPTTSPEGAKFNQWAVKNGNSVTYYNAGSAIDVKNDISISPVWDYTGQNTSTITFDTTDCIVVKVENGKWIVQRSVTVNGTMKEFTVKTGTSINLPDNEFWVVNDSVGTAKFKCWNIFVRNNGELTQLAQDMQPGTNYTVTGDIVLKPYWEDRTRYIVYKLDENTAPISEGEHDGKQYPTISWNYKVPNNFFEKKGYIFAGWKMTKYHGNTVEETKDVYPGDVSKSNKNEYWFELTAKWIQVANIINVDMDLFDGMPINTFHTRADYMLLGLGSKVDSYFDGWKIGDYKYQQGEVYRFDTPTIINLTAEWKASESGTSHLVTYPESTPQKELSLAHDSYHLLSPNFYEDRLGEEFDHWEVKVGSTETGSVVYKMYPGQRVHVIDDVTIKPIYLPKEYIELTFKDGAEGTYGPITIKSGGYTLPSCMFTNNGLTFSHWTIDEGATEYYVGQTVTLTQRTTLVAHFASDNPYVVSFYESDGVTIANAVTKKEDGSVAEEVQISGYNGIKSTEYNPEYWEAATGASNWQGPSAAGAINLGLSMNMSLILRDVAVYTVYVPNNEHSYSSINFMSIGSEVIGAGQTKVYGNNTFFLDESGHFFTVSKGSSSVETVTVTLAVTVSMGYQKVFGGWVTSSGQEVLPGDVVDSSVTDLYAKWVTPDVFVPSSDKVDMRKLGSYSYTMDLVTPYANLSALNKTLEPILMNYASEQRDVEMPWQDFGNYAHVIPGKDSSLQSARTAPDMYGTIYHIARERTNYDTTGIVRMNVSNGVNEASTPEQILSSLSAGTYRSADGQKGMITLLFPNATNPASYCQTSGNVIIDNIGIDGDNNVGTHGDSFGNALFANGHILIMGEGITNPGAGNWAWADSGGISPQIFGGSYRASIYDAAVENKAIVFGDGSTHDLTVDLGTCIIIHSGIYYNIAGGTTLVNNSNVNIGSEGEPLSTYVVLKGGITTDTVTGGFAGTSGFGNIYGKVNGGTGKNNGGTFVYNVGQFMPADTWEDRSLGVLDKYPQRADFSRLESSILTGGSNSVSNIYGSTHVFLSDDASVWDVQAGGRRDTSHTEFAYLEITGGAVVRHVACGTITDGADTRQSHNTVDSVEMFLNGGEGSYVANVFGAGFDTWANPKYKSMVSGTINVIMKGGTVGNLFGGGYRGSVGEGDLTINIDIQGGSITGDVYGGGSGGVDKIHHKSTGERDKSGGGFSYSMGQSVVNGTINVTIRGDAHVGGNVYGGGKSVPRLSYYNNDNNFQLENGRVDGSTPVEVAAVIGSVTVNIEGNPSISGSIFGGGRGIELASDGKAPDMTTMDVLEYRDGKYQMTKLPWYVRNNGTYDYQYDLSLYDNGDSATTIDEGCRYLNFAKVIGDTSIVINMGSTGSIQGDIYGGSAYGKVDNNTLVNIKSGKLAGSVFGGGLGRQDLISVHGERTVYIQGVEAVPVHIVGSVYGGSKYADDGSSSNFKDALVVITKGEIEGDVFGGSLLGNTFGNTHIYIGYSMPNLLSKVPVPYDFTGSSETVLKMNSVFAGGNISTGSDSEVDNPYTQNLVWGDGYIDVYSNVNNSVGIAGSIMGSGNASLTAGHTEINLHNLYNANSLTGIHRADVLTVDNCNLKILGRNPITKVFGQDKLVSVYNIGEFIMKNNASIAFDAPMDDIGVLKSHTKEGEPTTEKSPQNRFVFTNGSTVYVRSLDASGNLRYNPVDGFIIMVSTQGSYGAYALGMAGSNGGFAVASAGAMKEADTSISDESCCWYMSGISRKIVTMYLPAKPDYSSGQSTTSTYFSLTKFESDTQIMYTGGSFTKMANNPQGKTYSFVRPGSDSIDEDPANLSFAMAYQGGPLPADAIGLYDPTVRQMKVDGSSTSAGVAGTFFNKSGKEDDISGPDANRSLTSVPLAYTSSGRTSGEFYISLCLSGEPIDSTGYIGYLTLNFQAIKQINYSSIGEHGEVVIVPKYLVANTTEVRVDLYVAASSFAGGSDLTVDVKTSTDSEGKHNGESFTLTPVTNVISEVNLKYIDLTGAGSGSMPDIKLVSGSSYVLPECMYIPPEGKTFDCWRVTTGDQTVNKNPGETITVTANTVVKPHWKTTADLFFSAGEGTGNPFSMPVKCGTEFVMPESPFTAPNEKTFAKWSVQMGTVRGLTLSPGDTITITGNAIIKAMWGGTKTVSFDANEGSGTMDSIKKASGERLTLPDSKFTKDDSYFIYWTVGDTTDAKYPGDTIKVTENITLKANWTQGVTDTITFDKNGGTGEMNPVTVASGSRYVLPESGFTAPAGSHFSAWAVSVAGSTEARHVAGDIITVTNNVSVRAIWATEFTISFLPGTGSGTMDHVTVANNSTYKIPKSDFTAPSTEPSSTKQFGYWTSGTETYYPGQLITITNDVTLTAEWITVSTYNVVFDANGGIGNLPMMKKSGAYILPDCTFTPPTDKKFKEWSVDNASKAPGDLVTIGADKIILAIWEDATSASEFEIDFKETSESTEIKATENVRDGSVYTLPDNMFENLKERFAGWSISGISGKVYHPGDKIRVTSDLVVTPVQKGASDLTVDFTDGVTMTGIVQFNARTNPDNTTGWSNLGSSVLWDLSQRKIVSSSGYVGTLLGSIVGDIAFTVSGLKVLDSDGDEYLPTLKAHFVTGNYESNINMKILEKQYYSITYVDRGLEIKRYYEENTPLTRENCETPAGSNFNGWYLDSQFSNRYNYNIIVNDDSDGTVLYARYTYVVTLDLLNGVTYTLYVPQEDKGAMLTKDELPTPEYEGYAFKGWCKDKDLIYDWAYMSDRITEDTTLYARWLGMDVRVYFWYHDEAGKLILFGGVNDQNNSIKVEPVDGKYDLSKAYMMNKDRGIMPTVRWGSTFDVKDPYHDGISILDYAKNNIHFTGKFVKWTVVSPSNQHQLLGIYDDTILDGKIVKFVTDSMLANYNDIWEYYMYNDGGYPRIDWPQGSSRPDTMEVHLLAETTNVAIKVSMGLKAEDEQFASTIIIDDPKEFLVYPNGPDLSTKTVIGGKNFYYDEFGNVYHDGDVDDGVVSFYWNEDETAKYFYNVAGRCWHCVDPTVESSKYYEFIYKLNKATRNGYTLSGWHNEFVSGERALNPSPDLLRKVHITVDSQGYVNSAILITRDDEGNEVVTPLLVGNYTVDPKDVDADGKIQIVKTNVDTQYTEFDVYVDGVLHEKNEVIDGVLQKKYKVGDIISLTQPSRGGLDFVGWKVKDKIIGDSTYEVEETDPNAKGQIIIVSQWAQKITVELKNGNQVVRTFSGQHIGDIIPLPFVSDVGTNRFLGWNVNGGLFNDSYVLSLKDLTGTNRIEMNAAWSNDAKSNTLIRFATDHGNAPASTEATTVVLVNLGDIDGYRHVGWRVITGDNPRDISGTTYELPTSAPTSTSDEEDDVVLNDANALNEVILEAIWLEIYKVYKEGETNPVLAIAGDTVQLTYESEGARWRVSDDILVKGSSITPPDVNQVLAMHYMAIWKPIDYSLNLSQPGNGHVDVYMESRTGNNEMIHLSDEEIKNMAFRYGDKLRISYTPDTSKVAFVKWLINGQCYVANTSQPITIMIIQGDCSISVDESTGVALDLLIAFDNGNLNKMDRNYTNVYLHDTVTNEYFGARLIDGMFGMEHYIAKVPYGDNYETVLRFGEPAIGSGITGNLPTFDSYEEYSLVGKVTAQVGGETSFVYDVISASFIDSIPSNTQDFVDTEYGALIPGGVKYEFLYKDGEINPAAKNSVLPTGYEFIKDGSNHNIRVAKVTGTGDTGTKQVVAKVTKYVGILRSDLAVLAVRNLNINNPDGGTPPVIVTFNPNLDYNTYEGFPWEVSSKKVFAIETRINLAVGADSNLDPQKTFYLNWVRTDSPAGIIIQIGEHNTDHYVIADISKDGQLIHDDVKYDLGAVSEGYYEKSFPLEVIADYVPTIASKPTTLQTGEDISITSNNMLYLKISSGYSNQYSITINYVKDSAYYALNENAFGYTNVTYGGTPVVGSGHWGDQINLPTKFYAPNSASETVSVDILRWRVDRPIGGGGFVDNDNGFTYTIEKSDSRMTDVFEFFVKDAEDPTKYLKDICIGSTTGEVKYHVDSTNVYDNDGKKIELVLYTNPSCTVPYSVSSGSAKVYTDNRLIFTPLTTTATVTITFTTPIGTFSDGNQREVFEVTPGGTISDYMLVMDNASLITGFITQYKDDTSGDYKFRHFYSRELGLVFSVTSTVVVDRDIQFEAIWEPNTANNKTFIYDLVPATGDNAKITALQDAVEDSSLPVRVPNYMLRDSEITLSILPSSGYTVDVERTKGELGYVLISTDTYVDARMLAPLSMEGKNFSSWKLWNSGLAISPSSTHTEYVSSGKDGFIVYVADWGETHDAAYTVVYASKYGTISHSVEYSNNLTITLKGALTADGKTFNGWKLWNTGELLAGGDTMTLDDSAVKDSFILLVADWGETQSQNMVVFASQYGSIDNNATEYTPYYLDQYGSKYHKLDCSTVYRQNEKGSSVWVPYTVLDLTGKDGQYIRQYSSANHVYKSTRDGTFYEATVTEYSVAASDKTSYQWKVSSGSTIYYVHQNGAVYDDNDNLVHMVFFKENKLLNKATYAAGSSVYSATFAECRYPILGFHTEERADSPLYSSLYECIETGYLYYDLGIANGDQFKDMFGNVWVLSSGELAVRSETIYYQDWVTDEETHVSVYKELSKTLVYNNGVRPEDSTQNYYYKDQFGNHVVGNDLVNLKIPTLYLKKSDSSVDTLTVKYIRQNEYVKSLTADGGITYFIKKNGTLVDSEGKVVNGVLYHDPDCEKPYKGDYSIVMVDTKYVTYSPIRENGQTLYKDTFGNKYTDWLGTPTKLPGNRGFIWTFLLEDDLDLTVYTKRISYNINFIINGQKVNVTDLNRVSTISSTSANSTEFYGKDIPQYTIVAFDGSNNNHDIVWYTDPSYTQEYDIHNGRYLLRPDEFRVDTVIPAVGDYTGNTFEGWRLWDDTTTQAYNVGDSWSYSHDPEQTPLWKGDDGNYFYVFVADWKNVEKKEGYKVVFASKYGSLKSNLDVVSSLTINLNHGVDFKLTEPGKTFNGWKLWNNSGVIKDSSITVKPEDVKDGFILFVADWGEDDTYANNIVYATEFGRAPNMDSVKKYQYLSDHDISLYAHSGTYVLYIHDFYGNEKNTIMYQLTADESNKITIPKDHYDFGDYVFVGWSAFNENGKRVYTYIPEEQINVTSISGSLDLYPYYLHDGTLVKYYDGQYSSLRVGLDEVLASKQTLPESSYYIVKYSTTPIENITEGSDTPPSYKDVNVNSKPYDTYYCVKIGTPLAKGDSSHGNNEQYYVVSGYSTLRILPVSAYAVAPSLSVREGTDVLITNIAQSATNASDILIVTPDDIELVGIYEGDIDDNGKSITHKVGTSDSTADVTMSSPGKTVLTAVITLKDEAKHNYDLKYIDGSIVVYPKDAAKDEHVGN